MFTYEMLKEKNKKNKSRKGIECLTIKDKSVEDNEIYILASKSKVTTEMDIKHLIYSIMSSKIYLTNISILRNVKFSLYVMTLYKPYLKHHRYISNTIDYGVGDYYFVDRIQAVSAVSNYVTSYIQTSYVVVFNSENIEAENDIITNLLYIAKNRNIFDSTKYPLITKKFDDYERVKIKGGLVFDERFNFLLREYLDNNISSSILKDVIGKFYKTEMIVFTDNAEYKVIKKFSKEIPQREKSLSDNTSIGVKKKVTAYYETTKVKHNGLEETGIMEILDSSRLNFNVS